MLGTVTTRCSNPDCEVESRHGLHAGPHKLPAEKLASLKLDRLARRLLLAEAIRDSHPNPARYRSRLDSIAREADDAGITYQQICAVADGLRA
jgi:hypothetical protein